MNEFTPGPWKVVKDTLGTRIFTVRDNPQLHGPCPVITLGRTVDGAQVVIHPDDARLIAAAPELYEALKECLDVLENILEDTDTLPGDEGYPDHRKPNPLLVKARAALAKVEVPDE